MIDIAKKYLWIGGIIAVLALCIITGFHFFDVGKRKVALKATEDSLVVVQHEKAIIQKQRDSIGVVLKAATARSDSTRTVVRYIQDQTKIKGDSAFDNVGRFIQVLDTRISNRIKSDENHIVSLESELQVAKSLVKTDTLFIAKQEQETGLNKHIADLTRGSKGSVGLQVGGGYCQSAKGGTPCVYVGVGYSVRF